MLLTSLVVSALLCSGIHSEDDGLLPADIVFINDASGSVGSENFQKTLRFIENIVRGLVIGPYNAQIGSITFDTTVRPEFHLNAFSNQQAILDKVKRAQFTSGGTNTHLGLDYARETSFTREHGMRTFAAQIAIVITDGSSNDKDATAAAAQRLRDEGITIFSIGVGDGPEMSELNAIASDPDSKHVFSVDNFDSLNKIKESLAKRAREARPASLCPGQADIVFVLENSDRVRQHNLNMAVEFVLGVASDFIIGPEGVQIGVATFSDGFSSEFSLRSHRNKYSLKAALSTVQARGGATNTANAIRKMRESSFTLGAGHRAGVPKLAVVLTSGQSVDKDLTSKEARKARDDGIIVLAIGVGADVDEEELKSISTLRGGRNAYTATAFNALQWLRGFISAKLCQESEQEVSASTSDVHTCGPQADIVFMVDCSGRVENFELLLDFITSFVKELAIGQDKTRVAVGKFSSRPYSEFHLSRYENSGALLAGIHQIQHRAGGRDTAAAIRYMETTMFKAANGDRPEVPNIAIVMTDGLSTNPKETKAAAAQARSNGVTMFSLGIGNLTSRVELNDMATEPHNRHVLAVTDFTKLNSLKTAFQGQVCHDIPEVLPPYKPPVPTVPTPGPDTCRDQIPNCATYSQSVCSSNRLWSGTNCALTCMFCTPSTPTVAPPCEDKLPDCPSYGLGVCTGSSQAWGTENCRRFCGFCSPGALTVGVVDKCFYKGEEYNQGDKWDDGCAYECECADASKGQYVCYNKCPSYFNLPKTCELRQKPGKCCLEPECRFDETYTQKEEDALCVYNGQRYREGDIWFVGCEFECICVDAVTGFYACQSKCPKHDSLPENCRLVRPPGECCERPDCQFQTQVAKFTGSSGARRPTNRRGYNSSTCVDEIPDCHLYQPDLCSSSANRSFALENCGKFCSLCDSDSGSAPTDVCIYQGRSFQQGNTWYDGCEKTCVCDDASTGYIRCEDRCPEYLNIPAGCSLVTVPGQCCRSLSCDTPATFTGSQTRTDTVGAVPAPVPAGQVMEYPTLPPGQTYAPGQNPALLTAGPPTQSQISTGESRLGILSTLSPNNASAGPGDKLNVVLQPGLACDPVEEGQPTTLTCRGDLESCPNLFKVKWQAQRREIATCTSSLCGSPYTSQNIFGAVVGVGNSSLTISNVSRSSPFDMETKWRCSVCGSKDVFECDKLQVYALPSEPDCTVEEDLDLVSGDITAVTLTCSTSKVYPEAQCTFYTISSNGSQVQILQTVVYSHLDTGESPAYYSSECAVRVSVQELGQGTHSFLAYIFPRVTGGESLVTGIMPNVTVSLELPRASHSCFPEAVDGEFRENVIRCNCSLESGGYPTAVSRWFLADRSFNLDPDDLILLTKDTNANQTLTCEAVSPLGRRAGSVLVVKFYTEPEATDLSSGPGPTAAPRVQHQESLNVAVVASVIIVVVVVAAVVSGVVARAVYAMRQRSSPAGGSRDIGPPLFITNDYMIPMEKTLFKSEVNVTTEGNEYETLPERISTFKPALTKTKDNLEESTNTSGGDYETLPDVTAAVKAAESSEGQASGDTTSAFVYDDGMSSDQCPMSSTC